MATICIISIPRTGTNHLCALLRNLPDVNAYYEVFNRSGLHGLGKPEVERLSGHFQENYSDHTDQNLVEKAKIEPGAIIDALNAHTESLGRQITVLKIFPKQLDHEILRDQVFLRANTYFIIVLRRAIDSFVSYMKARAIQTWHNTDTTNVKINANIDEYVTWHDSAHNWYSRIEAELRNNSIPYNIITYETAINVPNQRALHVFRLSLRPLGLNLDPARDLKNRGLAKQDQSQSLDQKIENWSEFKDQLAERRLLKGAMGYLL